MHCENCNLPHSGVYGSGRFCSSKCARGFSRKKDKKAGSVARAKAALPEARAKAKLTRIENAAIAWQTLGWNAIKGKVRRKKRIMDEQNHKCAVCEMETIWCGEQLNFQLDHINGQNDDNSRENLRMVCPNCHSQTETYCGRNKKLKRLCTIDPVSV